MSHFILSPELSGNSHSHTFSLAFDTLELALSIRWLYSSISGLWWEQVERFFIYLLAIWFSYSVEYQLRPFKIHIMWVIFSCPHLCEVNKVHVFCVIGLCCLCVLQISFSSPWAIFSGLHHSLWVLISYGVSIFLFIYTSPVSIDLLLIFPWKNPWNIGSVPLSNCKAEALIWLTGWEWKPSAD